MKNADMPAMPTFVAPRMDGGFDIGEEGLSKLEYFTAKSIDSATEDAEEMSLECSKKIIGLQPDDQWIFPQHWLELKAKLAVMNAKALLAELEKQP